MLFQLIKWSSRLSLFLLLSNFLSFGQTLEILNEYRNKYAGHHIVLKNNNYVVTIEMIKGVPRVVHHVHEEHLILDQNGLLALSEEHIDFSSFETLKINEAYAEVPDGKGSKKIHVTNEITQDVQASGSIFHDDMKETVLIFPRMEIGALRVLDYEIVMSENKFPFGFHFASYYPNPNVNFQIIADTNVQILFKEFHMNNANIQFSSVISKNKRTLKWSSSNPPIYKKDEGAPNRRYFSPHVLAQIEKYVFKGESIPVLGSTKDLYKWYYSNIEEVINEVPSEDIRLVADSISKTSSSEMELVKNIYYWVQNNIKYIAFEEGINGFVPRQPSAVMQKRYGDCKDMASIIYSMLKSQGIKSYLTWIGSRDLPYKYSEFPSSSCDNHMICTYKHNGNNYFLDATNNFLPFNEIAAFTMGKQAFIGIDQTRFEVAELPIPEPNYTTMVDTTFIEVKGRNIIGHSTTIFDGYYQQMLHYTASSALSDKHEDALSKLVNKGNNSFKVTKGKIGNVVNREQPLVLTFDFTVDNYVSLFEKEKYVNMILEKDISYGEMAEDRVAPFEFDQKSSDSYTVILKIPEGCQIKAIPPNKKYNSDVVDFSVTYVQKESQLLMTLQLDIKAILIEPQHFKAWNEYVKMLKSATGQSIVLIENS